MPIFRISLLRTIWKIVYDSKSYRLQCQWSCPSEFWSLFSSGKIWVLFASLWYADFKLENLMFFFSENFDPGATVDLIDTVLLFPGKMLVFGWISPDLEANRVYYWSYSESIHISQILVLIFITKLSSTKFFTRKVMSKAGPRISFLGAYNYKNWAKIGHPGQNLTLRQPTFFDFTISAAWRL